MPTPYENLVTELDWQFSRASLMLTPFSAASCMGSAIYTFHTYAAASMLHNGFPDVQGGLPTSQLYHLQASTYSTATAWLTSAAVTNWNTAYSALITDSLYIKRDGTTDLTGDWTIAANNITLTAGTLTANKITHAGTGSGNPLSIGGDWSAYRSAVGILTSANYIDFTCTNDQVTTPLVNAIQNATVLQDGSASTGTSESFDQVYEAMKFTASANMSCRSVGVRLKRTGTITNPTAAVYLRIYSDVAGSPGAQLVAANTTIPFGFLTTSFAEYQFGFSASYSFVSGTSYWIVLWIPTAPTGGGTIQIDTLNAGANEWAYSPAVIAWTLENNKRGWFKIYGRTYYSLYGYSQNNYGCVGASFNNYGLVGISTNLAGIYGYSVYGTGIVANSTYSYAIYATSTDGVAIYAQSSTNNAIRGISTSSFGGYFQSASNVGGYFISLSNSPGDFRMTGALTASTANPTVLISRLSTLGAFNVTGPVMHVVDNPSALGAGVASGALFQGTIGSTIRYSFNPRVVDGASAVLSFEDSASALSTAGAKLKSFRNNSVEKFFIGWDGSVTLNGNLTIGSGAAGVDYTLTVDGETNDGVITWMEDEAAWKIVKDLVIDDHAEGLVLKDDAAPAHYWRVSVDSAGILSTSDLGTSY